MKGKKLRVITQILAIITICLISFIGIYKQDANKMKNQVKDYELGKDLNGYREIVLEVSDANEVLDSDGKVVGNTDQYNDSSIESNSYQKSDNKINKEESLTKENFEKSKSIIEKRLKKLNVEDYNISVNTENGAIYLQIPENSETDHVVSNIVQVAKFQIKDSEDDSKIFITNSDIKKISALYNTETSGTTVYLRMNFNKNGKKILKDISSGDYATKSDSNSENKAEETNTSNEETTENEAEENTTSEGSSENSESNSQKKIILSIDNNDMITTSFDNPIQDGVIDLSMNKATTDSDSIADTLESASTIAAVVNSGEMPLTYKVSDNNYINSDIKIENVEQVIYIIAAITVIALVLLVIKYKLKGFIASMAYIGFVALDLLVIRYTNVTITLESIVAGIIILAINYMIVYKLLEISKKELDEKAQANKKEFKSILIKSIPIFIIAVVFTFVKWTKIATFGMFIFWGLILSIVYNYLVTKNMID